MRVLFGEDHEHFWRLTDEWIKLLHQVFATKDKAEKQRLLARMKAINIEQQDMLDKANSKS